MKPNQERFDAIYAAHHRDIWRYCLRRLQPPEEAEEAFSSTFRVAWEHLDQIPTGTEALPWLYSVARNQIRNSRRKFNRYDDLKRRLSAQRLSTSPLDPSEIGPSDADVVHQAMSRLRAKDRELLMLVAWENLSHLEISQILGCTENAVAIRLHRARRRLDKQLGIDRQEQNVKDPPVTRRVRDQGASVLGREGS